MSQAKVLLIFEDGSTLSQLFNSTQEDMAMLQMKREPAKRQYRMGIDWSSVIQMRHEGVIQ